MKTKILAGFLCLLLVIPVFALAEEENTMVTLQMDGREEQIEFACTHGDEMVFIGQYGVYTWKPGDSGATSYVWEDGYTTEIETNAQTGESMSRLRENLAIFSEDGETYLISAVVEMSSWDSEIIGPSICRIVLEDSTARLEEVDGSEVDWELLTDWDDSMPSLKPMANAAYVDGVLYGTAFIEPSIRPVSIPVDGSSANICESVANEEIFLPYKDDKLVVAHVDYEQEAIVWAIWDPATDDTEELAAVGLENFSEPMGFAYDEQSDLLYYVDNGCVMALDLYTGALQKVAGMPLQMHDMIGCFSAMLGDYYVLAMEDGSIAARSVNSESTAVEHQLRISNGTDASAVRAAAYQFGSVRPDAAVAIANEAMPSNQIVEALLNQSTDYDIYVLSSSDEAFYAAYSRGYLPEITGSEEIDRFFASMYPSLAEQLSIGGVPVAIPISVAASGLGVSKAALEKAGLTMADIPTNWLELLDSFDELNAKLAGTGVYLFDTGYSQDYAKQLLLETIFADYMAYMQHEDMQTGFATDALRSILDALEQVDFAALGLSETGNADAMWGGFFFSDPETALFQGEVIRTANGYTEGMEPLLLAMTPDVQPVSLMEATVAFINPYSESKELAVQFLESVLENISRADLVNLCNVEIQPTRASTYADDKAYAQEKLERLQTTLIQAKESEKQDLEDQIAETLTLLEYIEEHYWDVSPEAIAWQQSHTDVQELKLYSPLDSGDAGSEIATGISRYLQGEYSAEELLQALDRKLKMMILEGN